MKKQRRAINTTALTPTHLSDLYLQHMLEFAATYPDCEFTVVREHPKARGRVGPLRRLCARLLETLRKISEVQSLTEARRLAKESLQKEGLP